MIELTDRQRQVWELSKEGLNNCKIGRKLDITEATVRGTLKIAKSKALVENMAPGFEINEKTEGRWYIDEDGNKRVEYLKSKRENSYEAVKGLTQLIDEVLNGLNTPIPRMPKTQRPKIYRHQDDYMNSFVFVD